ncbi:docking protein 2 isoform X2 [Oryzias melastigma]|uniref:docking protein 2 isoform X2 n=1 Tax=Oryzias melastigma TaxID=30732 RepID=UPI00168D6245|nr:docking protein 2 isoform X2 [Oryzias melastigma]
MEEDIRKQGMLFLQQQRFGKKWRKVWCVLYRESSCSISRLEFFECKDGNLEKNDKNLRKQQDHKKMNWLDQGSKSSNLQRGNQLERSQGMEDNSLYSGRETARDFRVSVRKTDASDRCRLKGDGVLRADTEALHLLDRAGDVVYSWPYRYLRRFGRDKCTFSFEAGRRCDSGEGNFEFDTKEGNFLFQAVEAAINLQKISLPQRQISAGGQGGADTPQNPNQTTPSLNLPSAHSWTPPTPHPRTQIPQPPSPQADGVYSMVSEPVHLQTMQHKDNDRSTSPQQQQRPQMSQLEPPRDKILTGVKSLTLDNRGLPVSRKNQVKMISSCPLPNPGPDSKPNPPPNPHHGSKLSSNPNGSQTYSQVSHGAVSRRSIKRENMGGGISPPCTPPLKSKDPDYSLPFDTLISSDILNSLQAFGDDAGADPLYDSIDEMKIRNIFRDETETLGPAYGKLEHIYDEPEGCAVPAPTQEFVPATVVYDNPEEMKGDAWKIMGTTADPKGHEYPYNPRVDDYAVPKRVQRVMTASQGCSQEAQQEEGEEQPELEEGEEQTEEMRDSPYKNVMMKIE